MKIMLISSACLECPPSTYGGLEMIVYDLALQLNKRGHQVSVAAPKGSIFPESIDFIPTVDVQLNKWDENIALLAYLDRASDTDLIHDHSHNKEIYKLLALHEDDNRYCSTLHCPTSILYPVRNPCLVTISKDHHDRIREKYGYFSEVVYNGIDLDRFVYRENKSNRFVFLGRPHPDKGNVTAINYCKELDVPLDMVGGMLEEDANDYSISVAQKCVIGSKWTYHGSVKHNEKAEILANARALIFPCADSWNEPFGLIIPEANASGTPVVAWNRGVFKETVVHGVTGFLADTKEEFLEYMKRVDEISPSKCRQFVQDNFTKEIMTDGYIKVYEKIMKGEKW